MFDGLFYINIPRLSHNGMENPRPNKFVHYKLHLHKSYNTKCNERYSTADTVVHTLCILASQ